MRGVQHLDIVSRFSWALYLFDFAWLTGSQAVTASDALGYSLEETIYYERSSAQIYRKLVSGKNLMNWFRIINELEQQNHNLGFWENITNDMRELVYNNFQARDPNLQEVRSLELKAKSPLPSNSPKVSFWDLGFQVAFVAFCVAAFSQSFWIGLVWNSLGFRFKLQSNSLRHWSA